VDFAGKNQRRRKEISSEKQKLRRGKRKDTEGLGKRWVTFVGGGRIHMGPRTRGRKS